MLAECITYRNPKNDDTIESRFTSEEAINILAEQKDNRFCQSLVNQYHERGLSEAQWYWVHKLAHQHNKPDIKIELSCDLLQWMKDAGLERLMWRLKEEKEIGFARIKLFANEYSIKVVYSGGDYAKRVGEVKGMLYFPNNRISEKVQKLISVQLMMLAKYKMDFMQAYGREWGVCFVCGRQLENEESVRLGIGPICRERF
jgi:hypothetical protein